MADFNSLGGGAPQMQPGGSPAAQGFYGFHNELLRRAAAQQEQQRYEQEQAAKQAAAAQLARVQEAQMAEHASATAANNAYKEEQTQRLHDAANEAALTRLRGGLSLGQGDKADYDEMVKLAGKNAANNAFKIVTTPAREAVAAVPEVPEVPAGDDGSENPSGVPGVPGVAAIDAAPESTTYAYRGDKAEQLLERNRNYMQEVVDGKHGEVSPAVKAEYQWQLSGAKGVLPAQVVNTPEMKKGAHDLEMQQYEAEAAQGVKHSPAKDAEYAAWHSRNHTDDEKVANAKTVATTAARVAEDVQASKETFQARQKLRADMVAEDKALEKEFERVDRAQTMLANPNLLTDAVAAPEVLQIVAGGMGSGLRMTDAELRRVNEAQTYMAQLAARIKKFGFGSEDPTTIQADLRKNMQDVLDVVAAAKERKARLMEDTYVNISAATTEEAVDQLRVVYWAKRREATKTHTTKAPASKWSIQ